MFGLFLPEKKIGEFYFIHTISGQLPVKKKIIETFSSFAVFQDICGIKDVSEKCYTKFSNLTALLVTTPTFLNKKKKKNEFKE